MKKQPSRKDLFVRLCKELRRIARNRILVKAWRKRNPNHQSKWLALLKTEPSP